MGVNTDLVDIIEEDIYQIKENIDSPQDINLIQNMFNDFKNRIKANYDLIKNTSILDVNKDYLEAIKVENKAMDAIPRSGFYFCSTANGVTRLPTGVNNAMVEVIFVNATTMIMKIIDIDNLNNYFAKTAYLGTAAINWSITTLVNGMTLESTDELKNKTVFDETNFIGADVLYTTVINKNSSDIPRLTLVAYDGWDEAEGYMQVRVYDTNDGDYPCLGICFEDMVSGSTGRVIRMGPVGSVDTTLLANGTVLYGAADGEFSTVKPANNPQVVAVVTRGGVLEGEIYLQISEVLDSRITLAGNEFNNVGKLVKLDANGKIIDELFNDTVTLVGNEFNGANQLVQLDADGNLTNNIRGAGSVLFEKNIWGGF